MQTGTRLEIDKKRQELLDLLESLEKGSGQPMLS
jgi:hypothetical protein